MIKNIFNKFIIDKKNSFMIGDKKSDEQCADKSNIKFYYAEKNFKNKKNNSVIINNFILIISENLN